MKKWWCLFALALPCYTLFAEEGEPVKLETVTVSSDGGGETIASDSGFEVNDIDVEVYKNSSGDVNRVIRSSPGIIIRESGGLGSSSKLYINGLSGNQIRYFVDGLPMENFGSALSLGNFPINLINGVEVYKGVVPTELSADALGGAININTPAPGQELLDVSYSYGSFNTHRLAVVGQSMVGDQFYYRISSFFNHSDNDYWMNEVPRVDSLGNDLGDMRAKRFHDAYTSQMVSVKTGLLDTGFADDLALTLTYAGNDNEVQHPDNTINQVFGGYHSSNETYLASLNYKKQFDQLRIGAYLLAGKIVETDNDTVSRQYDWSGNSVPYSANQENLGEFDSKTIFHLKDRIKSANLHGEYQLGDDSRVSLSWAANHLRRVGEEEVDPLNLMFSRPNEVKKNVLAANYGFDALDDRFSGNVFVKKYDFDALVIAPDELEGDHILFETRAERDETGYGATSKYALNDQVDVKASYEYAIRMPEPDEILGDGQWVFPSPSLLPETSHNINVGMQHRLAKATYELTTDINLFSREAENFIAYPPSTGGPRDAYGNLMDVSIRGIEAAGSLVVDNRHTLQGNITWQDMRDNSSLDDDGKPNTHKGDRLPNEPYLFANLRAGTWKDIGMADRLSLFWTVNYVHSYFFYWESLGESDRKHTIPTQLTHDIDLEYAVDYGTYNIALSARNIFDESVYDKRAIQKPGRAFYLKLRYAY